MGLRDNAYAKIWSAKKNGNIYSVNMTISRKDKVSGEYKQQFSGFVTFAGEAAKKVEGLGLPEKMDRNNPHSRSIQVKGSPDITTYMDAEKYKRLLDAASGNNELSQFVRNRANEKYITIWDFELADSSNVTSSKPKATSPKPEAKMPSEPVTEDDELPF